MADDRLARLSRDVHKIIGSRLQDAQLDDLLGLKPLSPQIVNRYFQTRARIQLKKGQSAQLVHALEKLRGESVAAPPSRPSTIDSDDPDLAALATPRGQQLARVMRDILREVQFDQVNHDLRLPQYGGDYDL